MRAALPRMRARGQGLVVWVSSSSARGGTPPFLSPYFAAKAGMDSLAVSYASELARWGIETSIMVPGAFTSGTNHFAHAGSPDGRAMADAYLTGPYADVPSKALDGLRALEPNDADPSAMARGIVDIVNAPTGKRPFRVRVDPSQDGSEVVSGVANRIRAEMPIAASTSLTPSFKAARAIRACSGFIDTLYLFVDHEEHVLRRGDVVSGRYVSRPSFLSFEQAILPLKVAAIKGAGSAEIQRADSTADHICIFQALERD